MILILSVSTALGALALAASWARDVPKVATGFIARVPLLGTFVSASIPSEVFPKRPPRCPAPGC